MRPEDVPAAAASLVRAFYEDPVLAYMFPNPRTRAKALGRFFRFQLRRTYLTRGVAYTTEECHSIALWLPPKSSQLGIRDVLAQLPMLLILGRRVGRGPAARAARRISSPADGALLPRRARHRSAVAGQGSRLGRARPVLESCDREGMPAYLESSKESNIPFYRRHGFEVTDEVSVPGRIGPAVAHVAGASGTALGLVGA